MDLESPPRPSLMFGHRSFPSQNVTDDPSWTALQEAETLVVPFVVSLMNLVVPLFYSLFNKFEVYSSQRKQIYALVVR